MAKLEVEVGDDGKVGTLPEPLQKFVDGLIKDAVGSAAGKAREEGAKEIKALQGQIDDLKKGNLGAAERERLRTLEGERSKLEEQLAIKDKDFAKAQEIRDKRHADEIAERDAKVQAANDQVARRDKRITELVGKEIALAASAAGARKESLAELQQLLGGRIGLDDGLQPFVRDDKDPGKAALDKDGQPLSIEAYVTQYLTDHPHHKAGPAGRGGGAPGGRSMAGAPPAGDVPDGTNAAETWGTVNKRAS